MKNLIDTNVWIDAIAGNLSKKAFLKVTVEAEWAGYSAITLSNIERMALEPDPKMQIRKERSNHEEHP